MGREGGQCRRRVHQRCHDLLAALDIASGISQSEVSRICADLDNIGRSIPQPTARPPRVKGRLSRGHVPPRPQHHLAGPLDGRRSPTGIPANGDREILVCDIGESEDRSVYATGSCAKPALRVDRWGAVSGVPVS